MSKSAKQKQEKKAAAQSPNAQNVIVQPKIELNLELIDDVVVYIETGHFEFSHKKYMDSYNMIVDKCIDDTMGKNLYDYYIYRTNLFLNQKIISKLERVGKGQALLKEFIKSFDDFKLFANYLRKIFDYVDRMFHNFNQQNYKRLPHAALNMFKEKAFVRSQESIVHSILLELKKQRQSSESNRALVNKSLRAIVAMGTEKANIVKKGDDYIWKGSINDQYFTKTFENKFLQESQSFYTQKQEEWMRSMSTPDYCAQIYKIFKEQEQRADTYINPTTKHKLMKALINILLMRNVNQLLERKQTGLRDLLEHSRIKDLQLLYEVFSRDSGTFQNMASFLMPYIEDKGNQIIQDKKLIDNPLEFIHELLKFRGDMNRLVKESFKANTLLNHRKDKAFTVFLAKSQQAPKFLAFHCDNLLKTALKGDLQNEEVVNNKLDEIIDLLCCLTSRDTFILSYSKFLSSRLLNKQFLSLDVEKQLLSKLKFELGATQVNKLSIMFTDLDASENLMKNWKSQSHEGKIKGMQMSFRILTDGSWPQSQSPPLPLPDQMKDSIDVFTRFYKNTKPQTKVKWMFHHGTMELKTEFTKDSYYFTCTTTQGIIMLAFNFKSEFRYKELIDMLKMPEGEVDQFLKLMVNPKRYKLFIKQNMKSPKFDKDEMIKLNPGFKSQQRALSLIQQSKGKKQQNEEIDNAANDDELKKERQFQVDAMIVKIMKTRKQLNHLQLVTQVIQMIKMFQAQPQLIKQRIQALIEREYLERDENDRTLYRYLP